MKKKHVKKALLLSGMLALVVFLSACGATGEVSANSTGIWDRYIVWNFARAIKALSFGNAGIGIILFTLIVRIILMPLMHFQTKSMRKTQELQPKIKALQAQYSAKDMETQQKLKEETQKLYAEHNVNPYAGCLPLLVQMPILMALWQAIQRVPELSQGHFLWLNLGEKDPYLILMMGLGLASGLSLYWVVSNAFQVVQTLLINNPFKIRKEREEALRQEKARERALERAMNPKKKKRKK